MGNPLPLLSFPPGQLMFDALPLPLPPPLRLTTLPPFLPVQLITFSFSISLFATDYNLPLPFSSRISLGEEEASPSRGS